CGAGSVSTRRSGAQLEPERTGRDSSERGRFEVDRRDGLALPRAADPTDTGGHRQGVLAPRAPPQPWPEHTLDRKEALSPSISRPNRRPRRPPFLVLARPDLLAADSPARAVQPGI